MNDPYQVLGIQRGASEDEIKKAYRTQCKRWHPDLNPNDPTAEEHFKQVQEAYDTIMKGGGSAQQSAYGGAGSYGAYNRQNGYGESGYAEYNDPFGFGDIFGQAFGGGASYTRAGSAGYQPTDSAELQAAHNFILNSRYAEARRVLDGIVQRGARWYYLSALANSGLGRSVDALADARLACQMEPSNSEYRTLYARLQNPAGAYRTRSQSYGAPAGFGRWCLSMILLNLVCNLCAGGSCCRGAYFGSGYYM